MIGHHRKSLFHHIKSFLWNGYRFPSVFFRLSYININHLQQNSIRSGSDSQLHVMSSEDLMCDTQGTNQNEWGRGNNKLICVSDLFLPHLSFPLTFIVVTFWQFKGRREEMLQAEFSHLSLFSRELASRSAWERLAMCFAVYATLILSFPICFLIIKPSMANAEQKTIHL